MTGDEFRRRWMTLGYNRLRHQGGNAEFPAERSDWRRHAYGRNGSGRHGLFCFGSEYVVETTREGKRSEFRIRIASGRDPFEIVHEAESRAEGHGTTLSVVVERNLPAPDRIRDVLAARFLFDPRFSVSVNDLSIPISELPGLLDQKVLTVDSSTKVEVICIEGDAGKTKHQSGVAFWVGERLVGEPSWVVGEEQLIDGRTRPGRRLTFIVRSDDLFDEVLPDWSGFRDSELMKSVRAAVREQVRAVLSRLLAERVKETKSEVLEEHRGQLQELEPGARMEVAALVETVARNNPLMAPAAMSAFVDGAVEVKKSSALQALLDRITSLPEEDVEGMNRLLDEWSVRDALVVLDEISRRIKLAEILEKLTGDPNADELHVIHPLVTQARWLFGPEFESATYGSNISIRKAVEKVFGAKLPASAFLNPKKRADLIFLPDATLSAVATEDFDVASGMARLRTVLLIELKKGDATIGREAINQSDSYVQDILNCGLLDGKPFVYAFVVGHRVDPMMEPVRRVGEPERARIEAHSFSQLVRTANARLFRIRDRVQERYPETGLDLINVLRTVPGGTENLGLFDAATPRLGVKPEA